MASDLSTQPSSPTIHQAFSKSHVEYVSPEFLNITTKKDFFPENPTSACRSSFKRKIFSSSNKFHVREIYQKIVNSSSNLLGLAFEGKRYASQEFINCSY